MNEQPIVQDVAGKLIERWKAVMTEWRKAKNDENEMKASIYHREGEFLKKLIDEIDQKLTTRLPDWEMYKQHPAPDILFSPDSTDVEPRF